MKFYIFILYSFALLNPCAYAMDNFSENSEKKDHFEAKTFFPDISKKNKHVKKDSLDSAQEPQEMLKKKIREKLLYSPENKKKLGL